VHKVNEANQQIVGRESRWLSGCFALSLVRPDVSGLIEIAPPRQLYRSTAERSYEAIYRSWNLTINSRQSGICSVAVICNRFDGDGPLASKSGTGSYYVEVCKLPNQEERPALSIVFTATAGQYEAMRVYSKQCWQASKTRRHLC
jgi:hypothetical protein